MTNNAAVRETANQYALWAIALPLTGVLAFHLDGVFIGATWSRDMTYMMIVSALIYIVSWEMFTSPLGAHGLWLAINIYLLARGFTLALCISRNMRRTFG